jgi:DNA-binding NarL/FixJ family response regulator
MTLGRPVAAAYASYREAEARLTSGGPRAAAQRALSASVAAADAAGARLLHEHAVALARRARLDIDPASDTVDVTTRPAPDASGLSPRELEVLALIALGRTNNQIAAELFISPKTAGVHVTHILEKLGVNSRLEAAMTAARLGIVREPEPQST